VAVSALAFPFKGIQPFPWFLVVAPMIAAIALAVRAPQAWRTVRAGAAVYAVGTLLTWLIPSQVGSNVDRLALLFGGALLLAAAMHRRSTVLYVAFATTVVSQVGRPVFDLVNTSAQTQSSAAVIDALQRLRADRGRVEVVPERTHLEASELATRVDLARGWNRQADVQRNRLFYDGALTPGAYHDWLHRWAVHYVVLSDAEPDWPGLGEARIVRAGQPWLRPVWRGPHWSVYQVADAAPLAEAPAAVEHADDGEIDLSMPASGSVLIRVPWSPWLGVEGGDGCVTRAGAWTRLHARAPGRYRLGAWYRLPRGTPC
jgi:hypothetical protein